MKNLIKSNTIIALATFLLITFVSYTQTVTDIDGNIYNTVEIGSQTWLKEDMRVLHYPDGSEITEVWAYNNNDSLASIYGRLYTWNGAMNNSTEEKAQGICPDGWHIPSDAEWTELGNCLGGDDIAGGKLKEEGNDHWNSPNTGATNESGFTALPAGEYDDTHYQFLGEYNVIWSSTQANSIYAKYRYIPYNDAALHTYTYYKDFRYSVRCVKNETVGIDNKKRKGMLIYPNPVDLVLNIEQTKADNKIITIYSQQGTKVKEFKIENNKHIENMQSLMAGIYLLKIDNNGTVEYTKIIKK